MKLEKDTIIKRLNRVTVYCVSCSMVVRLEPDLSGDFGDGDWRGCLYFVPPGSQAHDVGRWAAVSWLLLDLSGRA